MSSIPAPNTVEEMRELAHKMGIAERTVDEAKSILSKAMGNKKLKKRNMNDLAKASLYFACRLNNEPVPLGSFGAETEDRKRVFRAYQSMKKELEISLVPVDALSILCKLCWMLDVPDEVRAEAERIMEMSGSDRRSPQTRAQASLLLASAMCGYRITPKRMHEMTGSNMTVVRSAARDMAEQLKMDPYEEFTRRLCESLSQGMGETAVGLLRDARRICPDIIKRPVNALAAGIAYYARGSRACLYL